MTVWMIRTRRSYADVPDSVPLSGTLLATPSTAQRAPSPTQRDVVVVGDVALLDVAHGRTALLDAADVPLIEGRLWRTRKGKHTFYVETRDAQLGGRVSTALLHRVLMTPPAGMVVDHINGDGLDNRRQNLRVVSVAQNNLNSRVRRDSVSGVKGAFYRSRTGRYYSRIKVAGRYVGLGSFLTAEEAADAYAKASALHHGEFGRTHLDD
jgi:hypothetical protein